MQRVVHECPEELMMACQHRLCESCTRSGWTSGWTSNVCSSHVGSSAVRRAITTLVVLLVLSIAAAPTAWSQSSTASLRGTVTDPQGAVVAGAEVVLNDPAIALSRTQKTDDRGVYQLLQVPPGTYNVSVAAAGFTTTRRENVVLQV